MKENIINYVARCLECQQVKAEHRHPTILLQPHAISESKWEVILIYFIVGLPLPERRHDLIFCGSQHPDESAHFIPVHTTYKAPDITRFFISDMVRLHGMPERIIYNQGSMFTG